MIFQNNDCLLQHQGYGKNGLEYKSIAFLHSLWLL